ncbi:MAG: outer membrane beta-barrel protein [Bacteroidales bacterium]|nr:outer membrane beta-barrel protein [Bacteroidales bacterium]
MKKLLVLAVAVLMAATSMKTQAQSENYMHLSAGYVITPFNTNFDNDDLLDSPMGLGASFLYGIMLNETGESLEVGLNANYTTSKETYASEKDVFNFVTMSIPINFASQMRINQDWTFQPYVGFYARLNLVAKVKHENDRDHSETYNLFDDEDWRRFQIGANTGFRFKYKNLSFGYLYQHDLMKIVKENGNKARVGTHSINFGVFL